MESIVIATTKSWDIKNFHDLQCNFSTQYTFYIITSPDVLVYDYLQTIKPKYIFFPHWSWIIPESIYQEFQCIVFHMTDLPFGRGGSPLQNLLIQGIYKTKISALKVEKELDSGNIYLKEDLDISQGNAKDIYTRASNLIFKKMIPTLLENTIQPYVQEGNVTIFKRRIPKESNIDTLQNKSLERLYDFIRMLDAPEYPKAFIQIDTLKIEFYNAHLNSKKLVGNFEVTIHE